MNSRRPFRWVLLGLAGAAALFWGLGALVPGGLLLSLRPPGGGQPVLELPLSAGERFTLHYFHSVNHLPIWEEHSVDGSGRIFIEEERFLSLNAGMGNWPGRGRHVQKGGVQVIEDIHQPTGEFVLRVGNPGVDHTIIWRGRRFPLTPGHAGQPLVVSARPVGLWEAWRARWFSSSLDQQSGVTP